jgi:uncharacterized membrane protein
MNFCTKCGKQLAQGQAFCTGCGAPVEEEKHQRQNQNAGQQTGGTAFNDILNTPETQFDSADIEANKLMAMLSYFGLLFLVPLFAAPKSPFARYHANQGIILCITAFILGAASGVVGLFLRHIPFGRAMDNLISLAISAVVLILMILGIVNSLNGKAKELPIIGRYRILK